MTTADDLKKQLNAKFGEGTVMLGSDKDLEVTYLPTGVAPVDYLLGGGLARGRMVEFFGDYSTLKSYVGLRAIASCQAAGGHAALIDTEHAYDESWARECGVDTEALIVQRPPNGERAIDVAETLLRGDIDLLVFDSVAATLPKAEEEMGLSGDKNVQPARLAALMSVALRKLTTANGKTAVMWINQTRLNVGMVFGNPETTPGGKALPFYASQRVRMTKAGKVSESYDTIVTSSDGKPMKKSVKKTVGQSIKMTLEKSKLSSPFAEVYFVFDQKEGKVDDLGFLINLGIEKGVVIKSGQSWQLKGSATKTRGYEAFRAKVDENRLKTLLGFTARQPARKAARGRLRRSKG